MATIRCRCGGIFSDGSIPCYEEFHLLPDVAVEEVVEQIIAMADAEDPVVAPNKEFGAVNEP